MALPDNAADVGVGVRRYNVDVIANGTDVAVAAIALVGLANPAGPANEVTVGVNGGEIEV